MPSVLPLSSTPSHFVRFHAPDVQVAFGLRDVAGLREQHAPWCARRCRQHVRLRRVDDHHAAARWRRDVDVVDPDAGPADDHQVVTGFEHLGGDLRGAADHERGRAAHRFEQFVGREPEPDVDVEAGAAHGVEAAVGEPFGDEHPLHGEARRRPRRRHVAERSVPEELRDALDPFDERVVAERERQPRVARRAERLARHDRDLRLLEEDLAELETRGAACARRARDRGHPRTRGSSRTRPAARCT